MRAYEVDLLRFVAAMVVLVYHYAFRGAGADGFSPLSYPWFMPAAQYGTLGVDFFFMISGFVITMSAEGATLREFIVSRVVRLFPAFWVCCTITALASIVSAQPMFQPALGQYLVNMTMLAGAFGVPYVDGVYWSLTVELSFYALVAVAVSLRLMKHLDALLWCWLGVTIAQRFIHSGPLWHVFMAEFAPLFIAGAACFLLRRRFTWARLALYLCTFPVALWQALLLLHIRAPHYVHAHFSDAWIIGGYVLMYLLMLAVAMGWLRWIAWKRWVVVGALTYPLYLVHQFVGYMAFNRWFDGTNVHAMFWGVMAGAVVLAWGVNRFVERPLAPRMKALLLARRVSYQGSPS